jgi:hypothetical protein
MFGGALINEDYVRYLEGQYKERVSFNDAKITRIM